MSASTREMVEVLIAISPYGLLLAAVVWSEAAELRRVRRETADEAMPGRRRS
jgi:hypothetical protein